ncbi:hypothetical protein ACOMHN_054584 [Nucella lapillus]
MCLSSIPYSVVDMCLRAAESESVVQDFSAICGQELSGTQKTVYHRRLRPLRRAAQRLFLCWKILRPDKYRRTPQHKGRTRTEHSHTLSHTARNV